jgi:hypothetical protein
MTTKPDLEQQTTRTGTGKAPSPRNKQSKPPNARADNNRVLLPQSTPGPKVALQADKRFRFDAALPLPKRATGLCETNGLKAGR